MAALCLHEPVIVDASYHYYRIELGGEATDISPQLGEAGTLMVGADAMYVSCYTESGPVSVRVLVGAGSPGPTEDAWRAEWENVQDGSTMFIGPAEIRTWEGDPSDPPSGLFASPGGWQFRFHARGRAKVEDRAVVDTAQEEHLLMLWPPGAPSANLSTWNEVSGELSPPEPFRIGYLFGDAKVKTPEGYYRLVWKSGSLSSVQGQVPTEPTIVQLRGQALIATGTKKAIQVQLRGNPTSPGLPQATWAWLPVADTLIEADAPVRLLDGSGSPPRSFPDPVLPPGNWIVQLRMIPFNEGEDFEGHGEPADQMLFVWPAEAPPPVWD